MKDLPTVTFAPGGRAACVKGMTWLLVDCSLTHPMVLEAWGVIDRGGSVDEVVGAILSHGMTSAPDFALVAATGNIYAGLWYAIVIAVMTVIIGTLFVPNNTHKKDIFADDGL